MTNKVKSRIFKASGIALDVIPPFIATLTQFPIWVEKSSGATVSGLFLVIAFLCILPFWKKVCAYLKSPDIVVVWLIILVMLLGLRAIIDEMLIVCFVGVLSNCIGMGLYKIGGLFANKIENKD